MSGDDKHENEQDLIVWKPEDDGGNAVIAMLAGDVELEPFDANGVPEPPLAVPPKTPIKIPNQ